MEKPRVWLQQRGSWGGGLEEAMMDLWEENRAEIEKNRNPKVYIFMANELNKRSRNSGKDMNMVRNKIMNMKRKYFNEKELLEQNPDHVITWPFYKRVEKLVGPNSKPRKICVSDPLAASGSAVKSESNIDSEYIDDLVTDSTQGDFDESFASLLEPVIETNGQKTTEKRTAESVPQNNSKKFRITYSDINEEILEEIRRSNRELERHSSYSNRFLENSNKLFKKCIEVMEESNIISKNIQELIQQHIDDNPFN